VGREAAEPGGEFPSPIVSVELLNDEEIEVVSMRKAAAVAAVKGCVRLLGSKF
jgi:hypothetical protein